MSIVPSPLEIRIFATDGEVTRFIQDDVQEARRILHQIQPNRVFTQRQIVVAGLRSLNAFQTSAIARIDLVTTERIDWPFHYGVSDTIEITEEEFKERYRPEETGTTRTGQEFAPGQVVTMYAAVDLLGFEGIYLEIDMQVRDQQLTPMDTNLFLQQLFSSNGMFARRKDGGAILINPANVVRLTFFPGPRETPPNAWPARFAPE